MCACLLRQVVPRQVHVLIEMLNSATEEREKATARDRVRVSTQQRRTQARARGHLHKLTHMNFSRIQKMACTMTKSARQKKLTTMTARSYGLLKSSARVHACTSGLPSVGGHTCSTNSSSRHAMTMLYSPTSCATLSAISSLRSLAFASTTEESTAGGSAGCAASSSCADTGAAALRPYTGMPTRSFSSASSAPSGSRSAPSERKKNAV
jgi:ABC-type anion transport system duplicated permease subunit